MRNYEKPFIVVTCPTCGSGPGRACMKAVDRNRVPTTPHIARIRMYFAHQGGGLQ